MEALENPSSLQNPGGVSKTYTKSFWHGGTEGQPLLEEKVEYKSRDKDPWDSIPRALSITTLNFGIDPAYPSRPVFAQDATQAKKMFAIFRMQPVHGGDPNKCPVIGALDTEGITATPDMIDRDRDIRLIHADSWGRCVQDFPAAEYGIPGLASPQEQAARNKHTTPLRTYPQKKTPEKLAYYLWKDEYKAKLRYIPNVQTSNSVPFVLVMTGPHMPVFVIPFHLLFEPHSLFPERLKQGQYYTATGDPNAWEVDAETTPSVPCQWALDELSGAADRHLGYCGKVWLMVDVRSELVWLTKAFTGITLTRTSYSGSPGTDTHSKALPKLGFKGRQGGRKSNCYIPCIGVEECLRATGDEDFFQAIPSMQGIGKVPEFTAYGVPITILQWAEGQRHLTHPSLHWILRQQIGDALGDLEKRFKARLHEGTTSPSYSVPARSPGGTAHEGGVEDSDGRSGGPFPPAWIHPVPRNIPSPHRRILVVSPRPPHGVPSGRRGCHILGIPQLCHPTDSHPGCRSRCQGRVRENVEPDPPSHQERL